MLVVTAMARNSLSLIPAAFLFVSDPTLSLLYYFGPPILFILFCMTVVRLAGSRQKQLGWITLTLPRWLAAWSALGFAIAFVLAVVALVMNNDYVANHAQWIWPGCLGLVAFAGKPTLPVVLLLLVVAGLQNAFVYAVLAWIVSIASRLLSRVRKQRTVLPSILDIRKRDAK